MSILPPSKPGARAPPSRPPSSALLKPIHSGVSDVKKSSEALLLPSIHSSRGTISHISAPPLPTLAGTEPAEKKKGRPTKAQKMKEKRARASEGVKALVDSEPSKTDVHKYFESRIKQLLAEES
jgi:hypothetical protein